MKLFVCTLFVCSIYTYIAAQETSRPRLVIIPFDDTVITPELKQFNLGEKISTELTRVLEQTGQFNVISATETSRLILNLKLTPDDLQLNQNLLALGTTCTADMIVSGIINNVIISPVTRKHNYLGEVTDTQAEIAIVVSLTDVKTQKSIVTLLEKKQEFQVGIDPVLSVNVIPDEKKFSGSIVYNIIKKTCRSIALKITRTLSLSKIKKTIPTPISPQGKPTRFTEELIKTYQE